MFHKKITTKDILLVNEDGGCSGVTQKDKNIELRDRLDIVERSFKELRKLLGIEIKKEVYTTWDDEDKISYSYVFSKKNKKTNKK